MQDKTDARKDKPVLLSVNELNETYLPNKTKLNNNKKRL